MSGDFEEVVLAMLREPRELDAVMLHDAMAVSLWTFIMFYFKINPYVTNKLSGQYHLHESTSNLKRISGISSLFHFSFTVLVKRHYNKKCDWTVPGWFCQFS